MVFISHLPLGTLRLQAVRRTAKRNGPGARFADRCALSGRIVAGSRLAPREIMKTILVGVDGSPGSAAATAKAVELARPMKAALHLIHAVPHVVDAPSDPLILGDDWSLRRTERGQRILRDAQSQFGEAPDFELKTSLLQGPPADCIAQVAEREDVWLVVVGHRDRGAVARKMLGSCADRLLQICPKPVVVVRSGEVR
jgi:nucleotide-binding universal stress UspA family protein